jgi:uncharacterized protein
MHVARLSRSPLKGGRRAHPSSLAVTPGGVRGDRRFCLVDVARARVLRTVENPALLGVGVRLEPYAGGTRLTLDVPGHGPVAGDVPDTVDAAGDARTGEPAVLEADYWGRRPRLRVREGPWAGVLGAWLGREVVLAEAEPGDVVYAGAVSLVTTSSVAELAARTGADVGGSDALAHEADRWRANVLVDTGDAEPFVEDAWEGREVRVGEVRLRVRGGVPRCAVVARRPGDGATEEADALAALAPDRRRDGALCFGVDAEVLRPGTLHAADPVALA